MTPGLEFLGMRAHAVGDFGASVKPRIVVFRRGAF